MEITFENRRRRMERLARPGGMKQELPAGAGEPAASAAEPRTDRVSSSRQAVRQAVEQLEEQGRRLAALVRQDQPAEKMPFLWDMPDGEEETGDSPADALGEQMKAMERCHKIAERIMRGDKVPPQDEQYLMMNDPDGYKLALAMRTPKRKPKEWESVLKDGDREVRRGAGESSEEGTSCEKTGEASDAGTDSGE